MDLDNLVLSNASALYKGKYTESNGEKICRIPLNAMTMDRKGQGENDSKRRLEFVMVRSGH